MSQVTETPLGHPRSRRRAGRTLQRLAAAVVALLVLVAAYGAYSYYSHLPPSGTTNLVVYTYDSFFGGNCGANLSSVLGPFESAHHVSVSFECPSGTLLSTLLSQQNSPAADVVV
ncbi:MAG: hypothetical protein L3K06_08085, partial [Thermoplasmata archaeon]|nr:hypothetical protein [Thermoplasmata archaeon]